MEPSFEMLSLEAGMAPSPGMLPAAGMEPSFEMLSLEAGMEPSFGMLSLEAGMEPSFEMLSLEAEMAHSPGMLPAAGMALVVMEAGAYHAANWPSERPR